MLARAAQLHPLILVVAWLSGNALQLRQERLWSAGAYVLGAGCALLIVVSIALQAARRAHRSSARNAAPSPRAWVIAVLVVGVAVLAFSATGWRAHQRLHPELDASLEGVDIVVTGVVASLPRTSPDGVHFEFDVESPRDKLPPRLALGWYRDGWHGEGDRDDVARIAAGERWQFTLRLRQPHGLMNPHGFDFELWLFERGINATGSVRAGRDHRRLGLDRSRVVERARQAVRDAIERHVADPRASGLLAALAVGDQSAIDRAEWDLYRATGVSHLMSISGLHVTMFAWLAAAIVNAVWRRSLRACMWCPAPTAARVGGVMFAAAYAVLAGWGVPAQRTVWMLATVVLLQVIGRRWPWPWVLGAAALVVVAIDPWAWLQPGFWLSFVAVGLLMWSDASRRRGDDDDRAAAATVATALRRAWATLRDGVRTQLIATAGLAPLTLVFFQQVSIVGLAANLIAIPIVTLVVTPLALAGIALPPLWSLAAGVIDALHHALAWMGQAPSATWSAPVAPWWAQISGLAAGALVVAPLPWRARAFALPLALPLLLPVVDRPVPGSYEVIAADVGQGTAVLVRTATKLMLFDTGPAYARERNAGERVLLPLLRARGETRIDHLVLSHQDIDHVGGAPALIDALPVGTLWSSLPDAHALRGRGLAHRTCEAGASWQWDGVRFEVLHPIPGAVAVDMPAPKPNALSCVVRVIDAQGHALLIAGDIEAPQEAALLATRTEVRAHALIVAHHGSRTSTTGAWLDAVQPRFAIVQAGYRNRYGHPAPDVTRRIESHGVRLLRSDECGAWTWRGGGDEGFVCEREARRRYWHHRSNDNIEHP